MTRRTILQMAGASSLAAAASAAAAEGNTGTVTMGTNQLDIDDLVSLTNTKVSDYTKAPDGMRIGYMNLRVGDLAQANGFYRNTIGFDPTRER